MTVKDYKDLPRGIKLLGCFKSDRFQAVINLNSEEPETREVAERFNRGEFAISKDGKIYYGSTHLFL